MARTTNSDTLPYVESRYELGMLASQRVRDLNGGAEAVVDKNDDKLTVVALREIATNCQLYIILGVNSPSHNRKIASPTNFSCISHKKGLGRFKRNRCRLKICLNLKI